MWLTLLASLALAVDVEGLAPASVVAARCSKTLVEGDVTDAVWGEAVPGVLGKTWYKLKVSRVWRGEVASDSEIWMGLIGVPHTVSDVAHPVVGSHVFFALAPLSDGQRQKLSPGIPKDGLPTLRSSYSAGQFERLARSSDGALVAVPLECGHCDLEKSALWEAFITRWLAEGAHADSVTCPN